MRILIVDDDYISRVKLSQLLSSYGQCDNSPNGDIALRLFEAAQKELAPYSLITVDIQMPDMSGQELVATLRRTEQEWKTPGEMVTKILMVAASDSARDVVSSYYEGCDGYLAKPIDQRRLRQALAEMKLDVE